MGVVDTIFALIDGYDLFILVAIALVSILAGFWLHGRWRTKFLLSGVALVLFVSMIIRSFVEGVDWHSLVVLYFFATLPFHVVGWLNEGILIRDEVLPLVRATIIVFKIAERRYAELRLRTLLKKLLIQRMRAKARNVFTGGGA